MDFQKIWDEANEAGRKAAEACTPRPMVVQQVNPITGEVIKTYEPITEGACGFAYVKIRPANAPLARWLKAQNKGFKAYNGGWDVSIHDYGQSWERKAAHAAAAAMVLKRHGIDAFAHDRMD